jgi:hypothetical protein
VLLYLLAHILLLLVLEEMEAPQHLQQGQAEQTHLHLAKQQLLAAVEAQVDSNNLAL